MRKLWILLPGFLLGVALPLFAQTGAPGPRTVSPYGLKLLSTSSETKQENGKPVRFIQVKFRISRQGDQEFDAGSDYRVRILEEGKEVKEVDLPEPKVEIRDDLSVVLAVDTSGSMREYGRMDQARKAAGVFFEKLPPQAPAGLVLFNDKVRISLPLTKDRRPLRQAIESTPPDGGTAYLDACRTGIEELAGVQDDQKAVVVMTDGVDLNSETPFDEVIRRAQASGVKLYPVGIGAAGGQSKVTSILVLDRSASMLEPANKEENVSKLDALKEAARRFINTVRYTREGLVRTNILVFSDQVGNPMQFTANKQQLLPYIEGLEAGGETAFLDATYTALGAIDAENPDGKRAVITLTDGIDNASRRRVEEVIDKAKKLNVPLFLLGFGEKGELDEELMQRMAEQTGGAYFHAASQAGLIKLFEDLSVRLHDDGIDEAALKKLASETGGEYYHAANISDLQFILAKVTEKLQTAEETYEITFPSIIQRDDGLVGEIELKLVRLREGGSGNPEELQTAAGQYQRRGLLLAQMNPVVYLTFLIVLVGLLAVPAGLHRLGKTAGGR